ncbi:hypothetical protein WAE61_01900 [Comamonadaceae bacterium PP-2]
MTKNFDLPRDDVLILKILAWLDSRREGDSLSIEKDPEFKDVDLQNLRKQKYILMKERLIDATCASADGGDDALFLSSTLPDAGRAYLARHR